MQARGLLRPRSCEVDTRPPPDGGGSVHSCMHGCAAQAAHRQGPCGHHHVAAPMGAPLAWCTAHARVYARTGTCVRTPRRGCRYPHARVSVRADGLWAAHSREAVCLPAPRFTPLWRDPFRFRHSHPLWSRCVTCVTRQVVRPVSLGNQFGICQRHRPTCIYADHTPCAPAARRARRRSSAMSSHTLHMRSDHAPLTDFRVRNRPRKDLAH